MNWTGKQDMLIYARYIHEVTSKNEQQKDKHLKGGNSNILKAKNLT